MRIALLAITLALGANACSPASMPLPMGHPARADAPAGRLADPPAALQPGTPAPVEPADEPPPADHSGHGGAPR